MARLDPKEASLKHTDSWKLGVTNEITGQCLSKFVSLKTLAFTANNKKLGEGLGMHITLETRVGYRVRQGFLSRNASRNMRGRVQGDVQLVPLISCSSEAIYFKI